MTLRFISLVPIAAVALAGVAFTLFFASDLEGEYLVLGAGLLAFLCLGAFLFNHLLHTLGEATREKEASYAKLAQSHHTLEHKVEERTRELKEKNSRLEVTLAQLTATQEQLVAQERLASVAALAAGVSHELMNPLNFMNNFAQLSVELVSELQAQFEACQCEDPAGSWPALTALLQELEQNLQRLSEHGRRANGIVRDMLLHAHLNTAKQQWTDLNTLLVMQVELARRSAQLTDSGFDVSIREELDPSVGQILLFPQDFGRALLNVINNGFYAMSHKRKHVPATFFPEMFIFTRRVQDQVEVRIRDNGTGIPKHIQDKIFSPFFTTKPAGVGTGLGLSMTHDIIVQEHRGRIQVHSEDGQYTEFTFLMPVKGISADAGPRVFTLCSGR